jgi:hypothetical protein
MRHLITCFLLVALRLKAADVNAASASGPDVQTAINTAVNGDRVVVPTGTGLWTNVTADGKAIRIVGGGTNSVDVSGGPILLTWITTNTANISGIEGINFHNAFTEASPAGAFRIGGFTTNWRVMNCSFINFTNEIFSLNGGVIGVFASNHVNTSQGYRFVIEGLENIYSGLYGDKSWETNYVYGSRNAVFLENNDLWKDNNSFFSIVDNDGSLAGGRMVIRHNNLHNHRVSNHGTESSQRSRGFRVFEVYKNKFTNETATFGAALFLRSGGLLVCSNDIYGAWNGIAELVAYRTQGPFAPWGSADGTKLWDSNDLTDGAGTPGGAGDGVFESGTASSGNATTMTDGTKSWTVNQWANFTLRQTIPLTASSGGVRSATVSGASWVTDGWVGFEFTKVSDGTKGFVSGNTATTITLSSSYYGVDMTGGGNFVLSKGQLICANTATVLTMCDGIEGQHWGYTNAAYTIYKMAEVLDDPGRGQTVAFTGTQATPTSQNISQAQDTIHYWENYDDGSPAGVTANYSSIKAGRNYTNTSLSGWVPYTYPHPLLSQVEGSSERPVTQRSKVGRSLRSGATRK